MAKNRIARKSKISKSPKGTPFQGLRARRLSLGLAFAANRLEIIEWMATRPASEKSLEERTGAMLAKNRGSILLTKIGPVDTETVVLEVAE